MGKQSILLYVAVRCNAENTIRAKKNGVTSHCKHQRNTLLHDEHWSLCYKINRTSLATNHAAINNHGKQLRGATPEHDGIAQQTDLSTFIMKVQTLEAKNRM